MGRGAALVLFCLTLAACGTQPADRAFSGAGLGAGTGAALGGNPLVGALIGGGVGVATTHETINLGPPPWRW